MAKYKLFPLTCFFRVICQLRCERPTCFASSLPATLATTQLQRQQRFPQSRVIGEGMMDPPRIGFLFITSKHHYQS